MSDTQPTAPSSGEEEARPPEPRRREPIFNIPPVMLALVAVLLGIHALRVYGLTEAQDFWVIVNFAFVPARYTEPVLGLPAGIGPDLWTFVTYALLHADWGHVALNSVWMIAFGVPLARRLRPMRFLLFSVVAAIAGALAHLLTHFGEVVPMVGASGAIAGYMAGAARFYFLVPAGMPTDVPRWLMPLAPLRIVLTDGRTLSFLASWFGINLLVGLANVGVSADGSIAWQAHIGGFLVGLFLFPLFDPVRWIPAPPDQAAPPDDTGQGPADGQDLR